MVLRCPSWKHALSQIRAQKTCQRWKSSGGASAAAVALKESSGHLGRGAGTQQTVGGKAESNAAGKPVDLASLYTSISHHEKQRKSQERDFLVSVFSSSPTKRDTKKYLQIFGGDKSVKQLAPTQGLPRRIEPQKTHQALQPATGSKKDGSYKSKDSISAVSKSPQFVQGLQTERPAVFADGHPHVAIIKIQDPDTVDDGTLGNLAKTFVQLRALGLLPVIVIDRTVPTELQQTGNTRWLDYATSQTLRLVNAIDKYDEPIASLVDGAVGINECATNEPQYQHHPSSPSAPPKVYINEERLLQRPLQEGNIIVIPPYAYTSDELQAKPVDADDIVVALTRYFSGIQQQVAGDTEANTLAGPIASVDRVIIIDPVGGTPSQRRPNGAHIFLNLEHEYKSAIAALDKLSIRDAALLHGQSSPESSKLAGMMSKRHRSNLETAKCALALLPSSSSALFTTPTEAANLVSSQSDSAHDSDVFGYVGSVGTRRSQNPLIHNLLTDRPVFSSSLPLGRIKPKTKSTHEVDAPRMPKTTLLKRGMPLTMYPDPRKTPWVPPTPGGPRLRLTDTCIDLPRLVHLIEDSFNRKLDVQDYLKRVENSLAGVIIAGEYEGGAILTWERPFGLDEETAYHEGRMVPYLDKFAVLKKSQGAGGVADMVFTAMVRDCFPDGVCWRSRKDNPVNRWYFERSRGSWQLDGVNWTLFWTTPFEIVGERGLWDYADVCRNIGPSWADQKK